MISNKGFGRLAAVALLASGLFAGSAANAEEVTPEHLKAARAALAAVNVTKPFDDILPSLAEQLKGTLIQSSPNFQDIINTTVDENALKLAQRRGDLEAEAANIYAKTFTAKELQQIADFYSSPAGKKLLTDGPIAMRELSKAADIWAAGISRDLATQTDAELEKTISEQNKANETATPQ